MNHEYAAIETIESGIMSDRHPAKDSQDSTSSQTMDPATYDQSAVLFVDSLLLRELRDAL